MIMFSLQKVKSWAYKELFPYLLLRKFTVSDAGMLF